MSNISQDELEAELRRVAPNAVPPASEGWFNSVKAAQIWGMNRSAALHHLRRMTMAGEVEAWSGNREKCLAYYRLKKKRGEK